VYLHCDAILLEIIEMFSKILTFFEILFFTQFCSPWQIIISEKNYTFVVIIFLAKYFSENNNKILNENAFQKNR